MIFSRKWMEDVIDQTVLPRFQEGAGSSSIIALDVALLQACMPESIEKRRQMKMLASLLRSSFPADTGCRPEELRLI
jgi:glycine/serine hydroxymethyltransferase